MNIASAMKGMEMQCSNEEKSDNASTVVAKNLCIRYGDLSVIDNMSFKIQHQEFVSLLGPSGCGKSTLLRAIAGILNPASGELSLNIPGSNQNKSHPRVGLMFQKPLLLPWRTTLGNVLLPTEIELGGSKVSPLDVSRARHILSLVQLSNFEGAYPKQLSGGMQQRVALARALMSDPDLLLLDEPFGALDEFTREALNEELLNIWRSSETRLKTIVMVTHSISEAVALSDRIFVFAARPARLVETIPVDIVHPRNPESLEFIQNVKKTRSVMRSVL
jgi:NitT/TauT family transport system ATP-binding protein